MIAVPLTPMKFPSWSCNVVAHTRVGTLTGCLTQRGEALRLRPRDGRVIRFGRILGANFEGVAVSPNGRWLLLQADLPCDTRGAYVVRTSGGTPLQIPRPPQGCDYGLGFARGWTSTNRAVVRWEPDGCGCSLRAGVYALDPRTRSP
jgi:hypothetical protein